MNGREHWTTRDTWYNLLALGYQLTGEQEFLDYGLQQARLFLETRGSGADPILENVPLFTDYPGVPGYTALAVRSLRQGAGITRAENRAVSGTADLA